MPLRRFDTFRFCDEGRRCDYEGETALIVLAANSRFDPLLRMLRLIAAQVESGAFADAEVVRLLTAHPSGSFFQNEPICFLGGSLLSIAAAMGAKEVLTYLATSPTFTRVCVEEADGAVTYAIDFNANRCPLTGFLPIHAVVAVGLRDMHAHLLSLPPIRGTRVRAPSRRRGSTSAAVAARAPR